MCLSTMRVIHPGNSQPRKKTSKKVPKNRMFKLYVP